MIVKFKSDCFTYIEGTGDELVSSLEKARDSFRGLRDEIHNYCVMEYDIVNQTQWALRHIKEGNFVLAYVSIERVCYFLRGLLVYSSTDDGNTDILRSVFEDYMECSKRCKNFVFC